MEKKKNYIYIYILLILLHKNSSYFTESIRIKKKIAQTSAILNK